MKISKIPGFGNYGQIVDGADFDHITDEEWIDIGKKHLKNFVTVSVSYTHLTLPTIYSV